MCMAGLKTLDELKVLRDKHRNEVLHRDTTDSENKIRITVGMATCGIASGARETLLAISDELKNQNITNVTVVQAGCMGYCYAEPTIEIRVPGQEPILYGKVDALRGRELVTRHIKNGEVQKDWTIERI